MRTRARVINHGGVELCRLDVAKSSQPVWAKTSKEPHVFFVRMNNSSRAMPANGCAPRAAVRAPDCSYLTQCPGRLLAWLYPRFQVPAVNRTRRGMQPSLTTSNTSVDPETFHV